MLPLVHHLMKQRFDGVGPTVASEMAAADGDLRAVTISARRVVAQPALHPSGETNRDARELAAKARRVQLSMRLFHPVHDRRILGMRALTTWDALGDGDRMAEDDSAGDPFLGPRPTLDQGDDGPQHRVGRAEVATMHAELSAAEAHHRPTIVGEPASFDTPESQCTQPSEQRVGVRGNRGSWEA